MNWRRTLAKQFGIALMAIGGCLLFSCAMGGPVIDPPIDTETPALIALALIAIGLALVLVFRRERRPANPPSAAAARSEAIEELRTQPRTEPQPVAPKAPR